MLLLSRNIGESIMIGDDIEIYISDQQGKQVRVGIRAPNDVSIHRKELYTKIKEKQKDGEPMLSLAAKSTA